LQRQQCAVTGDDLVFVFVARLGAGDEDLPPAVAAHAHGMAAAIPQIEVADDADAARIRRPDDEGDAVDAFHLYRMGAELVVELQVIAFAEQIEVEVGQYRREAIGILELDLLLAVARAQAVLLAANRAGEQAGRIELGQFALAAVRHECDDLARLRQEYAHDRLVVLAMRPEIMERVGMPGRDDVAGFGRQRAHTVTPRALRMRKVTSIGIDAQVGRLLSSYSIS